MVRIVAVVIFTAKVLSAAESPGGTYECESVYKGATTKKALVVDADGNILTKFKALHADQGSVTFRDPLASVAPDKWEARGEFSAYGSFQKELFEVDGGANYKLCLAPQWLYLNKLKDGKWEMVLQAPTKLFLPNCSFTASEKRVFQCVRMALSY